MDWLKWLGRGPEKEMAYSRLGRLKEAYGAHGDRVIKLSARTDLARKSAGSTQRAFDFVERAFVDATGEYARIMDLIERLEAGLSKATVGDFAGAEKAVAALGPKLDDLQRHLENWEARWQQVPRSIDDSAHSLAELRQQVEAAAAAAGAPLPLTDKLARMEQHLDRCRQELARGNPIEAEHLVNDLRLAMQKVADEVVPYTGAAGAVAQAEQELADLKQRLAARAEAQGDAVAALAAAEALLPRLRPAVAAGKLEQMQQDLLSFHRHLSAVRAALK